MDQVHSTTTEHKKGSHISFEDRVLIQTCLKDHRELKRQIESSLFERLLLSKGDANKETVLALSQQGVV